MSLKIWLARLVLPFERLLDRVSQRRRSRAGSVIEPYYGLSTQQGTILRGRVLTRLRRSHPRPGQSRLRNLAGMIGLFLTREVANVRVATSDGAAETTSNEEGYFQLRLPPLKASGAPRQQICLPDRPEEPPVDLPVYTLHAAAQFGVISDIDDTLLQTGAYSLWRNLWTSMTGNALTRHVFPDAVSLIERLHAGINPVFYVSSSPWNMFHFLGEIFARHGLVAGPMFLRDLGISETQFITGTHGDHKGGAIDMILSACPDLDFVLVGDTGQHDADVYLDVISRHPGRITRVILRQPGPGPDRESVAAMRKIEAAGVSLHSAADYTGLIGADG